MRQELKLDELREYRTFIINYKTTSQMVNAFKDLLGWNYWTTNDFGSWLNAVSLFCDKTLQGKCSWQQYKHPTEATKKFLKAVLDYQDKYLN